MKWTPIVALICVTILTIVALLKGFDGVAYASSVAVLGGLGGFAVKAVIDKKKGG